ncbi:hypothetical protein OQI_27860 [Streptomyces pharetrae CZA14]|uniref:Integral membrane protein n=1 Tax=Streptomyces pharetrae CZA14 TaxID=1144883 RepID=A0ABX3YDN3_9ACTN|nr:hypothetical protein OQI_27860 [Streptomyces pharetrae CZA14]
MGTRTVDETAATTAEVTTGEATTGKAAEEAVTEETTGVDGTSADVTSGEAAEGDIADGDTAPADTVVTEAGPSGAGQGAGAVVAAALGVVSLTGSWVGTVASARESLIGQLETSSSSSVAAMVEAGYGDAWRAGALWAGLFALAALIAGVVVLARPAFGAPGRPQAPWIKSVAWAGVSLGVIGLLLAVLKYTDVLLGLPSAQPSA